MGKSNPQQNRNFDAVKIDKNSNPNLLKRGEGGGGREFERGGKQTSPFMCPPSLIEKNLQAKNQTQDSQNFDAVKIDKNQSSTTQGVLGERGSLRGRGDDFRVFGEANDPHLHIQVPLPTQEEKNFANQILESSEDSLTTSKSPQQVKSSTEQISESQKDSLFAESTDSLISISKGITMPTTSQKGQEMKKTSKSTNIQVKSAKAPKLYRPIIASALATALGVSVAVAEPTITTGNAANPNTPATITGDVLNWVTTGASPNDFYKPQFTPNSGTATDIENLNFSFNKDKSDIAGTGNNQTYIAGIGTSNANFFKITSVKALQIGATGTGTLNINMGDDSNKDTKRSFVLDLSQVTTIESNRKIAFKGNIEVNGGKSNDPTNRPSEFEAKFGGDVIGNIGIGLNGSYYDPGAKTFTFLNGSRLQGNLKVGKISGVINFEGDGGEITQGVDVGVDNYTGYLNLNFKGTSGSIGGLVNLNKGNLTIDGTDISIAKGVKAYNNSNLILNLKGQNNSIGLFDGTTNKSFELNASNPTINLISDATLTIKGDIKQEGGAKTTTTISGDQGTLILEKGYTGSHNAVGGKLIIDVKTLESQGEIYLKGQNSEAEISAYSFDIAKFRIGFYSWASQLQLTLKDGGNGVIRGNIYFGAENGDYAGGSVFNATLGTGSTLTLEGSIEKHQVAEAKKDKANFTLNSATLNLKGAKNTINTLTATGSNNTLTLESTAKTNTISTLTLGTTTETATNGTLNLSTANALTIDNLNVAHQNGTLGVDLSSQGQITIGTTTLGGKTLTVNNAGLGQNQKTLTFTTFNATGKDNHLVLGNQTGSTSIRTLSLDSNILQIENNSPKSLAINAFKGTGTSTLNLNKGGVEITKKITAGDKVSNTFNIESGATLTLTNGFQSSGGENKFFVKDNGTLTIGGITGADNKLTTTGAGSVSHFEISANAKFDFSTYYNALTATNGGKNSIVSAKGLSLTTIASTGDKAQNIIGLTDKTLTLTGDITATNTGKAEGSGNEVDAKVISMANNSIIANNGVNQIGIFSELTVGTLDAQQAGLNEIIVSNPDTTITLKSMKAQSAGENKITVRHSGTLTLQGENTGGNTIAMSASGAGSKNYIQFGGTTLNITGNITADQGGVNELDINALSLTGGISATGSADSKNIISLGAGSSSVSGNITEASGGQNLFTLAGAGGNKSILTLNGADNAITTLDMQANSEFIGNGDGTLTIGTLTTADASSTLTFNKGANTIKGGVKNTQATFNVGDGSVLTSLTFSAEITGAGSVNLKDKATLTLNGGNLKSLNTTGTTTTNFTKGTTTITDGIVAKASVKNNISLGENVTLTSAITANGGTNNITLANNSNITGNITATSGTNTITLTGIANTTSATINGAMSETGNSITLDSSGAKGDTTNLTLSGADAKTIANLTALSNDSSSMNTLTIAENAKGANTITNLNLGNSGTTKGFLTIDNSSGNALTIGTLTSAEAGNILTIGASEVIITNAVTNAGLSLKGATLTLNNANGDSTIASLTTTGTNTINLNKGTTTIKGVISGANNFKLDSSGANTKTALTLNGANNAITTLNALGNQNILTITDTAKGANTIKNLTLGVAATEGSSGQAGSLTIANNATDNTLTIDTFEGNFTDSKLTISKGAVTITNALQGENNNIALSDGTALTLNGGNLKNLSTAGTTTINFAKGTTTITGEITAEASVINNITLGNGAILNSAITANGGTNNVTLDSATLNPKGATNTITTLNLNQGNNTINLAGENDPSLARNEFRLLKVGEANHQVDTGLTNGNNASLTFISYLQDPSTIAGAKLAGVDASVGSGTYGYAYTDRVLVFNAGDNSQALGGTYNAKFYIKTGLDLSKIQYTQGKGTEQEGNIAILTIAQFNGASGTAKEKGIFQLGDKSITRSGLDFIGTTLVAVETDENGKVNTGASADKNKYVTYFVKYAEAINPDEGNDDTEKQQKEINSVMEKISFSVIDLYLANFNSLNKRMGELRENNHSQGIWARVFNGQQSNDLGIQSSTNYVTAQAGYDYAFGFEGANNYLGFAFSYSYSSGYKSKSTKNIGMGLNGFDTQLAEFALYNSYVADSGWYNDSIAKASFVMNSITMKDGNGNGVNNSKADFNSLAFSFSNELGYRVSLGENKEWFIDPQAEVGAGYINGSKFALKASDGTKDADMTINSTINLRARLGSSFGYDFKNFTQDKDLRAKLYLGVFYEMDYFHFINDGSIMDYQTTRKTYNVQSSNDLDHRAVLNVGTNLEVKNSTRIYFDFETSFAGKIKTDYRVNAGVRYSFGENANYKPSNAVKKDAEAEKAPLKIEEKEETKQEVKPTVEQEAQKAQVGSEAKKVEEKEVKAQEQAPKSENVEAKKPSKKKVAKKKVAKKQAAKKAEAKVEAKAETKQPALAQKAETKPANNAKKQTNRTKKSGGGWGWW